MDPLEKKSCPFCGGEASLIDYNAYGKKTYRVKCPLCNSEGPASRISDTAVRKWNERYGEATHRECASDFVKLVERLKHLKDRRVSSLFKDVSNFQVEEAVLDYGQTSDHSCGAYIHFCGSSSDESVCECDLCREITGLVKSIYGE